MGGNSKGSGVDSNTSNVGVGVRVGVAVAVGVAVTVGLGVGEGTSVAVGVADGREVGVSVGAPKPALHPERILTTITIPISLVTVNDCIGVIVACLNFATEVKYNFHQLNDSSVKINLKDI
jgi:hypothetical protein